MSRQRSTAKRMSPASRLHAERTGPHTGSTSTASSSRLGGLAASSDYILDLLETNERGEIHVDRALETGVRGVFAAGDVNNGRDKQVIIAAADGAKAALAAFNYLVHQV